MADIDFSNDPGGYSLRTQVTPFTVGGQGGGLPDMGNFFAEMARRKMAQARRERRIQEDRQAIQDQMQLQDFNANQQQRAQGMSQSADQARMAKEAWQRQKQAEDAPVFVGSQSVSGSSIGVTEKMPWQGDAGWSGYTRRQVNAMKPENASFTAGTAGPGMIQGENAANRQADDELERRKRMQQILQNDQDRMTPAQAGWGLPYQA